MNGLPALIAVQRDSPTVHRDLTRMDTIATYNGPDERLRHCAQRRRSRLTLRRCRFNDMTVTCSTTCEHDKRYRRGCMLTLNMTWATGVNITTDLSTFLCNSSCRAIRDTTPRQRL